MKRAFLVHGWSGLPDGGWRPWLKRELEERGWQVENLAMPDTDTPRIGTWVPFLATAIGKPDEDTVLVGHSMGCQAILRYLADLEEGQRIGGAYLVAGPLTSITNTDSDEERPIVAEWLGTPLDTERAKRAAGRIVAIFSDDDRYVPLENEVAVHETLGAMTIVLEKKGHLGEDDGVTEIPELLEEILR